MNLRTEAGNKMYILCFGVLAGIMHHPDNLVFFIHMIGNHIFVKYPYVVGVISLALQYHHIFFDRQYFQKAYTDAVERVYKSTVYGSQQTMDSLFLHSANKRDQT